MPKPFRFLSAGAQRRLAVSLLIALSTGVGILLLDATAPLILSAMAPALHAAHASPKTAHL
jgi:hypothetical protein